MSCSQKSRIFAKLTHRVLVVMLNVLTVSLFLTRAWAQSPDDFSVDYTGALFGYYRIEDPKQVKDEPEGSPIRQFNNNRSGHESRLLLGMGDNFAPEFGASIQLVGMGHCETSLNTKARNQYPPEILYKESDRYAPSGDCDNVANFLIQEKYRAVVPGREDFLYSAEWLRKIAWSLKKISGPNQQDDGQPNHKDDRIPDANKLHMLAANLRLKASADNSQGGGKDRLCPLLFAGSNDKDPVALKSGTVCVSSQGESVSEVQDWVERLDLTIGPSDERVGGEFVNEEDADHWQALAIQINRKAQSSAEVRRQLLINQVAQFMAMDPERLMPAGCEHLEQCIGQLAKPEGYAISGAEVHLTDKPRQHTQRARGAEQDTDPSSGKEAYEAFQTYVAELCQQPSKARGDRHDVCIFANGLSRIFRPICNNTGSCGKPRGARIDQVRFDFLLKYEERKAGRDALLRVFAKEQENIGYTFSDRPRSNGAIERTMLIGLVGVETMKAISPTNLSVKVEAQQEPSEKKPDAPVEGDLQCGTFTCGSKKQRVAYTSANRASITILKDVAVLDPRRTLLILLRATKLAADDEAAVDPTKAIVRTIVMAQMPHTEAEELGAHVRSELSQHGEWGSTSVTLMLSEAQADHATQTSDVTYTDGAILPILTPYPAFDRSIGGLASPISTVRIDDAGIHNEIRHNVFTEKDTTTLELLSAQLRKGYIGGILDNPSIKDRQSAKAEAEEFLLAELQKSSHADVVMLERRDVYLDALPRGYTDYEVCRTFNHKDAYHNPTGLSAEAMDKCELWIALDRVLWKGDFLERVMVSGKDLKDMLKKAQGVTTDEQTLAARDTVDQWLITFGITTSTPSQLTLLEVQGDRFGLPQDRGCVGDVNAPKSETPYCVNGAVIADDASYMVLTSDHIAHDSVLYTSLKMLPKDYHEHSSKFLTAELTRTLASKRLAALTKPIETCLHHKLTSQTPMECAQEGHQDRSLFHLDYGKAVAGFNVRKPEGGNAAASEFQGVADTRASQPSQQELDLESAVRLSSDVVGKVPLSWSIGIQSDAEYDRSVLGNLTGKPINASYALNTFTANAFLQHRIPFPGDAKTIDGDWGSRTLPRTLLVLTPHQYQQQITGAFLSVLYSAGNGEYTYHLPRVTGFVDKLGVRHEGGGTWTKFDRSTYGEGGFQLGVQNNILQSISFVTDASSQFCSASTNQSIAQCVAGNKRFLVNSSTIATDVITKTLHVSGLYWDVHIQKGIFKDTTSGTNGISATLDSKGDFFYQRSPGNSLSTQTRYAFPITTAINFPILRNLSLSPTYTAFLYESQVTRQSITVNSFMISAHWYYDRDASVPFLRQLFFKGPASLDQTKTAKLK